MNDAPLLGMNADALADVGGRACDRAPRRVADASMPVLPTTHGQAPHLCLHTLCLCPHLYLPGPTLLPPLPTPFSPCHTCCHHHHTPAPPPLTMPHPTCPLHLLHLPFTFTASPLPACTPAACLPCLHTCNPAHHPTFYTPTTPRTPYPPLDLLYLSLLYLSYCIWHGFLLCSHSFRQATIAMAGRDRFFWHFTGRLVWDGWMPLLRWLGWALCLPA